MSCWDYKMNSWRIEVKKSAYMAHLTDWKEKWRGKSGKTKGYCTSRKYEIWAPEILSNAERIDSLLQYGFVGRDYRDCVVTAKRMADDRRAWRCRVVWAKRRGTFILVALGSLLLNPTYFTWLIYQPVMLCSYKLAIYWTPYVLQ